MDWKSFEVTSAVVHYVPTERDDEGAPVPPVLTDVVIDLDVELKQYFRDKIADRLETKGLEIVVNPEKDQPVVPRSVAAIIKTPAKLVEQSKVIARHLHAIQNPINSSGLLAVLLGQVDGRRCVAVVKLERERGVRFSIDTLKGTVDLELLRNLTLTDKTKVYKTAVLATRGPASSVEGFVADDQRTSAKGRAVAGFFLDTFLGCQPKQPAAQITYEFVKAANVAFNRDVASAERKGRYQVALLSAIQDNTADIRPASFAQRHLDPADRPAFLERIARAGIDPKATFTKDTSRIKVDQFKMTFASGMVLVGSSAALETKVEVPDKPDAAHPVKLKDSVDSILTGR